MVRIRGIIPKCSNISGYWIVIIYPDLWIQRSSCPGLCATDAWLSSGSQTFILLYDHLGPDMTLSLEISSGVHPSYILPSFRVPCDNGVPLCVSSLYLKGPWSSHTISYDSNIIYIYTLVHTYTIIIYIHTYIIIIYIYILCINHIYIHAYIIIIYIYIHTYIIIIYIYTLI